MRPGFASSRHAHFSLESLRKFTETSGENQVERVTEGFSKCQGMSTRRAQRRTEPSATVAKAEEKPEDGGWGQVSEMEWGKRSSELHPFTPQPSRKEDGSVRSCHGRQYIMAAWKERAFPLRNISRLDQKWHDTWLAPLGEAASQMIDLFACSKPLGVSPGPDMNLRKMVNKTLSRSPRLPVLNCPIMFVPIQSWWPSSAKYDEGYPMAAPSSMWEVVPGEQASTRPQSGCLAIPTALP